MRSNKQIEKRKRTANSLNTYSYSNAWLACGRNLVARVEKPKT